MSAPVGYYAFIIGDDGHIQNRVGIFCTDDEEAKRFAMQLVDGDDVELWQLDRKIAEFKRSQSSAS